MKDVKIKKIRSDSVSGFLLLGGEDSVSVWTKTDIHR